VQYKINTSLPIQFEKIDNPPYLNDSRYQAVRCYVAHEKDNFNGSWFDKSVLESMGSNMAGVPIVGYISADNVNKNDFNGHEERLVVQDGDISIEYLGRAYGCIISNDDAEIVQRMHESGEMRNYLAVTGILWKMFSDSIDIFDRDISKPHSMELQDDSISGKFEKDGFYHFTDCKVRALCILGEGVQPAMSNSLIEKFSVSNYQDQVKELLTEIKESVKQFSTQQLSSIPIEVDNINPLNEEGGTKIIMDEKMELLNSYSTLSEEIIADLKINLEQYTLEDLKVKLDELSVVVEPIVEFVAEVVVEPVIETTEVLAKPTTEFSLTVEQVKDSFREKLSEEKYYDSWGYQSSCYYYIDYLPEENLVFAQDCKEGYSIVSFTYSMSGDEVIIDFTSKKECKIVFVPKVGEEPMEEMFSMVLKDVVDYELDCKGKAIESEKDKVITEVSDKFTLLESEVVELRQYKSGKIASDEYTAKETEINNLFSKKEFEILTEEEVSELKVKAFEMDLASVEKDLFALVGMKLVSKFSLVKNEDGTDIIKMSLETGIGHEEVVSTKSYADIIKKYSKQK